MNKESKQVRVLPLCEYYKVPTLKQKLADFRIIAKFHNIRIKPKRKQEFINELHDKMKQLFNVQKIQRVMRIKLRRILIKCHGPAYCNTKCCVNDTDFYTLDNINDIPPMFIFSYEDDSEKIYGFHWLSFLKLISGPKGTVCNPYNRTLIPQHVLQTFAKYLYFSDTVFKIKLRENVQEEPKMSKQVRYQQKLTDIFMKIDSLGNYSQIEWYNSLNQYRIVKFMQELNDIWGYRLNLSNEMKQNIIGLYDPLIGINFGALLNIPLEDLKMLGLNIIEKFIMSGVSNEYQTLGSIYVLTALTLVNPNAAEALPDLYQSVV